MLNVIERISRIMAYLGGVMLVALIIMVCISILGRSLSGILHSDIMQESLPTLANWLLDAGIGPIGGDYELLEAGIAFSIFAFLPICQMHSAHASVDVFASLMSKRVSNFMIWISEIAFALVLTLIAWQLTNGTMDKLRGGETTFFIQFPVWWAYGISMMGAYMAAIVAIMMAYFRSLEFFFGQKILVHIGGNGP